MIQIARLPKAMVEAANTISVARKLSTTCPIIDSRERPLRIIQPLKKTSSS